MSADSLARPCQPFSEQRFHQRRESGAAVLITYSANGFRLRWIRMNRAADF